MAPRPPFNIIISTVPAVRQTLYLDGCELTDDYPLSVVVDGQALKITMVSYMDRLAFGITGCRRTVPHLQRPLAHLADSLAALEDATRVDKPSAKSTVATTAPAKDSPAKATTTTATTARGGAAEGARPR